MAWPPERLAATIGMDGADERSEADLRIYMKQVWVGWNWNEPFIELYYI